jgi:uncharacterized membrane protein (DUF485 family)
MSNTDIDWQSVLQSARFQRLARRRRTLVLVLGALAAAYYFAIPALIAWAPDWFRVRVTDGLNLGTLFAVSQYPFAALIAWIFLRHTAVLDREAQSFVGRETGALPATEQRHAY